MKTYTTRATRVPGGWRLQCEQLPGAISEVRKLAHAEESQREAIAFVADVDEAEVGDVQLVIDLGHDMARRVDELSELSEQRRRLQEAESRERAGIARKLLEQDLSLRDVGAILGISHQRVAQIVNGR